METTRFAQGQKMRGAGLARTMTGGIATPDLVVVGHNLTCSIVVTNHGLGTANNGIALPNTLPICRASRAGIARW